jgi:hypothetical protein
VRIARGFKDPLDTGAAVSTITDRSPDYEYHLRVYNDSGVLIEDITDTALQQEAGIPNARGLLVDIFRGARSIGLGGDQVIENLIADIGKL